MPNWNDIYNDLFSAPVPAGQVTPDTDNVDFDDFPGVNKAKMQGGNDFADGNDGANVIFGNGGRDYLRGDGGDDSLHGGGGNDAIIGDSIEGPGLGGGAQAGNDLLWGGSGHDVIAGQNGNDDLDGGNGRDLLMGGNGNDTMNGGMGEDFLVGGNGNDNMRGGWNDDKLSGQLGNDVMRGGTGDDLMSGGDGEDSMYGGSHDDTMSGNAGHDYMNGGNGHDVMYGNSGHDNMRGWNGNDSMRGDCGDDAIAGERGDDLLLGDKGNDYITGGAGDDSIDGGKHNDIIEGNDNADCIYGGEGNDLIWGDNANPADPAEGEASDLIDGGDGNDTIYGGEDDDQINGGNDDDLIGGGTGDDTIAGDSGDDTINGNEGDDHINGNRGEDSIDGDSGNDVLAGGGDGDTINGGNGHDAISGDNGRDDLNGDNGNDTIDGGGGADTIDGGRGNDLLYGGDDGDTGDLIRGDAGQLGGGDDTLIGGGGNDTLDGGKGDDCLVSGSGNETLTGGADADTFYFGYADGVHGDDIITDFSKTNSDQIQLHTDVTIDDVSLDGNDIIIETSGGSIRVVDAVLTTSGLDPDDADFDGSSAALEAFITDYNPVNGEGKGFVFFEDKDVEFQLERPDDPYTGWKAEFPDAVTMTRDLSEDLIGDTTLNTTEQIMAARFLNGDVNVHLINGGTQIFFDPDASTPPTVAVTPSTEVIEDIDASAQVISQSGIVSFDDIDSTDTVTITFEFADGPVWSGGDFADVALDPGDLIAAFHTGVEDADKPGTTPWTFDGTFDLDFLAVGETITFTIDIIATDCDDATARVPLTFTITGTNDGPVANDDAPVFVEAGDTVLVDVLANDTDVDGMPDTSTLAFSDADVGTASNVGGQLSYAANDDSIVGDDESTADTVTYTFDDNDGATSNSASVVVNVIDPEEETATDSSPSTNGQLLTVTMSTEDRTFNDSSFVDINIDVGALDQPDINVSFVIDESGSINGTQFAQEQQAVQNTIDLLRAEFMGTGTDVEVQIVQFADGASSATFDLFDTDLDDVTTGTPISTQSGGLTNYEAALQQSVSFFTGQAGDENFMLFVSDGEPTGGGFLDEVATLNGLNVSLTAVGFSGATQATLDQIDNTGGAEVVADAGQIGDVFAASALFPADVFEFTLTVNGNDQGVGIGDLTSIGGGDFSYDGTLLGLDNSHGATNTVVATVGFDTNGDDIADAYREVTTYIDGTDGSDVVFAFA